VELLAAPATTLSKRESIMNQEEQNKKMGQVIAKCWADEDFKAKLLPDPVATLKDEGVDLPEGITIKAVENTDKVFHLVIPAAPTGELSEYDMDSVSGGGAGCGVSSRGGGYCFLCR